VTDDVSLEDALLDHPADLPGRLALCPARAPFERLARAKTAGAAQRFERQLAAVSLSCDVVLVDTPPIGSNQAVAAVNAADRRAIVTTDSPRGRDALALTRDRFADLGVDATAVIVNRAGDDPLADGDRAVPEADLSDPRTGPACVPPDESFAPAVARAVETGLGTTLDLEFPDGGRFSGLL
jgi:MinD-like ATPase involved in chromosome partitioning or flagellar assembly